MIKLCRAVDRLFPVKQIASIPALDLGVQRLDLVRLRYICNCEQYQPFQEYKAIYVISDTDVVYLMQGIQNISNSRTSGILDLRKSTEDLRYVPVIP